MTTHSKDELFQILSNSRRRYIIYYLHEAPAALSLKDLATKIAAEESDIPESEVSGDERQRVYISLYQTHLPKLEESGIIVYDEDERTVSLTDETIDRGFFWMDGPSTGGQSWLRYYGALSLLSWLLVGGVGLSVFPFTLLGWAGVALVVSIGLLFVVAAQYLADRQEVEDEMSGYETLIE